MNDNDVIQLQQRVDFLEDIIVRQGIELTDLKKEITSYQSNEINDITTVRHVIDSLNNKFNELNIERIEHLERIADLEIRLGRLINQKNN